MADSFMLELPDFDSAKTETTPQEDETYKPYYKPNMEDSTEADRSIEVEPTFPSFDKMIEQSIGTFGWAQLIQALLVAFSSFFDSQQTFISIFTDAHPKWHCTDDSICNSNSNICQLPKSAWAWDGPSTMVSEWDLGCSTSFITGLPASAYFMGSLLGGFFLATIADSSIGRKKLLFLSCLAMSVTTALTAFSTNIWVYSALRFVCGVGRVPIGTCNLVLLTEKVGKEWRGRVGVMEELLFTLGFLSLPGVAYINRGSSWRGLYLWTSIPTLIYCLMIQSFVSESPRWLFMEGRYQEAIKVLNTISPSRNNIPMPSLYLLDSHVTQKPTNTDPRPSSMIRKLFKKKWALQRIVALLIPGFCIGLGYFGMALGLGNLNMNLYLSVTYNAALEIPSSFLTFLMIEKWSRKGSLLTLCLLSGISGIMTTVAGNGGIQMGLQLVSFFCACTAYNVILIYTVELFPTCVRNFAMTAVRQTLIFGAVFGPVLVASWRNNELLSYRVFGALLLFSGFFIVRLPETKGMSLADTLDEQEHNDSMVV